MLITHHPLIFKAVKKVNDGDFIGRRLVALLQADIYVSPSPSPYTVTASSPNLSFTSPASSLRLTSFSRFPISRDSVLALYLEKEKARMQAILRELEGQETKKAQAGS